METPGSISVWLNSLRAGDRQVVRELWEAYFRRLVGLARRKLSGLVRGVDAEDVALSAFNSFCLRAEAGGFPSLEDRSGLWQVLVLLTTRKAANRIKFEGRQKRDWRRDDPALILGSDEHAFLDAISREPDPAEAVEIADNVRRLLDGLGDDEYRTIALRKMEGFTDQQIAEQIGRSVATVERRLEAIRVRWSSLG